MEQPKFSVIANGVTTYYSTQNLKTYPNNKKTKQHHGNSR